MSEWLLDRKTWVTAAFPELIGKVIVKVEGMEQYSDTVEMVTSEGETYRLFHDQNCCESVSVEEVIGDPADLIGQVVHDAEVSTDSDITHRPEIGYVDSFTWTFYRIVTPRGTVVLRWLGTSNGYYSESVDFARALTENEVLAEHNRRVACSSDGSVAVSGSSTTTSQS